MSFRVVWTAAAQNKMGVAVIASNKRKKAIFVLIKKIQEKLRGEWKERNGKYQVSNLDYQIELEWENKSDEKGEGKIIVACIKALSPTLFEKFVRECIWEINQEKAQKVIDKINEFLDDFLWFDFIAEAEHGNLYFTGSIDFYYSQDLEIVFKEVSFAICSSSFSTSPKEEKVFSLGAMEDFQLINDYPIYGYEILIKIKPSDTDKSFYLACSELACKIEHINYRKKLENIEEEKEKLLKKYGLFLENDAWHQEKENSHKAMIFKNDFYQRNDIVGLLFRINKLCAAKERYFREHIEEYEFYKYDYKEGFIKVQLWDSEFLRHKKTGYYIDYRYLQTITKKEDFLKFCTELEEAEKCEKEKEL